MALSKFPEGASNAATQGSEPVIHDHFGFDTGGLADGFQATDGWSNLKHSNIQPHDYGYEK
jgi:hypothetical protein